MGGPRWPNGAKAAVSFTMDNLGEAQDVNRGAWPADQPVGYHYSVREQLPRMLDLLDRHGIAATYFAESWSLAVYPDAVRELARRGHELAWHGYQHEPWATQSAEEEARNFEKSFEAAERAGGIRYSGFRPPGGSVSGDRTFALLREHAVEYVSPLLGSGGSSNGYVPSVDRNSGVVVLPFEWPAVDAFYYMDKFAPIRESLGRPHGVLPPQALRDFLLARIRAAVGEHGYVAILFHPFLQTSEDRFAVLEEVLAAISADPDIWCAPCNEVSRWVKEHRELFETGDS